MGTKTRVSEGPQREQKGTTYRIFRLLAWFNGLAAVGLALLLALPSFIDWSDYKEKIAQFGAQTYGLDIRIEGALYAQFLPTPIFKLNRVTVTKPGESTSNPLFIKRADVELDFLPLLRGKLQPRALLLHKPDFVFGFSDDKKLTFPIGLSEIFLSPKSGTISRFGVQEASFSHLETKTDSRPILSDINLLAEKSIGTENWSLQGFFSARDVRHNFQIITRGRPERSTTYIDAQIKNTGSAVLSHSFNGSVSEREGRVELQGRYQSGGRVDQDNFLYAVNARGKIRLSQAHLEISGFTVNASQAPSKEKSQKQKPVIVNLDLKAQKNMQSDKWQVESEIYAESLEERLLASALKLESDKTDALLRLNSLAQFMDGRLSLRAKNVRINSHLFPSVYTNVLFENNLMHFTDAGAKLPEGGRLQTERLTAGLVTRNQKKELIYKGAVYVKTRSARDLAALLPIRGGEAEKSSLSPGSNDISMSGLLQLSRSALSFTSDNLLVNDARGTAAFILRKGRDLRRDIFLNLEKVNLDRLLRSADKSFIDLIAGVAQSGQFQPEEGGATPVTKFNVSINNLLWRGTALRNIKTQGRFSSDEVSVQNFSIGGADDQSFALKLRGEVRNLASSPEGSFKVSLNSPETLDALSLIAPKFISSEKGKAFVKRSGVINPLTLKASLSSAPNEGKNWSLQLDGQLASTEFSSEGQFQPVLSQAGYSAKAVDIQFELTNPSSRILAAQIFSVSAEDFKAIPETEGYARASIIGSDEEGFDIALGGEVSDLQLTLGGTAKRVEGRSSIAAQIKLYSPKSLALSRLVGVSPIGDFGKTEYVANIAGSGNQYVISGGHGMIAGRAMTLDANLDLSGQKPQFAARAHTKHIGPDGLKSAVGIFANQGNAVKELASHIETQITLSAPLIRFAEGIDLTNAQAQITVNEEKTELNALQGTFYGGKLLMSAAVQEGEGGLKLSAQYELKDAELSRVLVQESQEKIAKGQFTLAGEASAEGATLQNIGKKLTGRGYIKGGKGELRGLNPAAFGRAVRFVTNGTELNGMIGGILGEGSIPFSQFQTAFTLKDGAVHSEKTQLISREVRAKNSTRIDIASAQVKSDWTFTLNRLPKTPAIKLQYSGKPHQLRRRVDSRNLRTHLLALMTKGEKLSTRFAAQRIPQAQADNILTGTVKRQLMKKPLKLEGLKIVPKANPLRGSN